MKQDRYYLIGFMIVSLLLKLTVININGGEYTDGILQLLVFKIDSGLYPPLYGALSYLVSLFGTDLETAGKIVSISASVLTLVPLFYMAKFLAGSTSAKFSLILFSVCALQWRWSLRVMTDSLYLFFSTLALYCIIRTVAAYLDSRKTSERESQMGLIVISDRFFACGIIVSALSVLTRYQGIVFAPLIAITGILLIIMRWRVSRGLKISVVPPWSSFALLSWITVPIWMWYHGFVHQGQFSERAVQTNQGMMLAWWNTFESFVLISPYYFGYPIMVLAIAALLNKLGQIEPGRKKAFIWCWLIPSLLLLVLHSIFGSFQYRYMLPILPLGCIVAGIGATNLEDYFRLREKAWVFRMAFMGGIIYLAFQSLSVVYLQSETFADQKIVAKKLKEYPKEVPVYANELYGSFEKLRCVKLSYWSDREVKSIFDSKTNDGIAKLPIGSLVILGTQYGGDSSVQGLFHSLSEKYVMEPVYQNPIFSRITPIHDDIMANPMFNQNPMMWVMRYVPQQFSTQMFLVKSVK